MDRCTPDRYDVEIGPVGDDYADKTQNGGCCHPRLANPKPPHRTWLLSLRTLQGKVDGHEESKTLHEAILNERPKVGVTPGANLGRCSRRHIMFRLTRPVRP